MSAVMSERPVGSPNAVTVVLGPACGDPRTAARRMLVRLAGALLGPDQGGGTPRVERDELGRPYLAGLCDSSGLSGRGRYEVSISHSADVVAVALATGRVGVDVETTRPLSATGLARHWFDADEAAWVAARPEESRTTDFLRLWTAKEALGKALGTGLRGGGTKRRVSARPPVGSGPEPGSQQGLGAWTSVPGQPFALALPVCPPDVVVAVVVEQPHPVEPLLLSGTGHGACRPPWSAPDTPGPGATGPGTTEADGTGPDSL